MDQPGHLGRGRLEAAGARLAREANLRKGTAYNLVRQATALSEMPETATALAAGKLTVEHVDLLATANTEHRRECFAADEGRLVGFCVELPHWAADKAVRYWECRVDALTGHDDGPEPRWRDRQATSHRGIDGEVHVDAIFDPVGGATFIEAERVDNELRHADEHNPDGPRSYPHPAPARCPRRAGHPGERRCGCPAAAAGHRGDRRSQLSQVV